jgi:hypothetical protein
MQTFATSRTASLKLFHRGQDLLSIQVRPRKIALHDHIVDTAVSHEFSPIAVIVDDQIRSTPNVLSFI